MDERIYLSQPHVTGEEKKYIDQAFSTNNLTLFGDNLTEFEQRIGKYVGTKGALATCCGTAAIHLALRYAGVSKDDRVLCQSLTFAASCNPILYQGGIPVFVDSDEDSWNMSPDALALALKKMNQTNQLPKAAVIVDLYGQPAKYDELLPLLKEYDIKVVEDAAEALGSEYMGKKCGDFGDYGAFSFNSNKIVTSGGGGMVVSQDEKAIAKMRYWAAQAREPLPYYEHKEYGYQYRMSNILAGIGCAQSKMIDKYAKRRQEIYDRYAQKLRDLPVSFLPKVAKGNPNCWLTVMSMENKSLPLQLIEYLDTLNIETRMVWKPMHLQPIFKECQYYSLDKDISKGLFEHGICLPSASVMTDEQQDLVIDSIRGFLRTNS